MPGKIKYKSLSKDQKKNLFSDFYKMVLSLKSEKEVENFFKDLFSTSEMVMVSRRIQIALLLFEGKTHEEVRLKLGVGYTTICTVNNWLENGFGGYKEAIRKKSTSKPEKVKYTGEQNSFYALRKKYPAHFALINLFLDKNK